MLIFYVFHLINNKFDPGVSEHCTADLERHILNISGKYYIKVKSKSVIIYTGENCIWVSKISLVLSFTYMAMKT